jgi:hypothetical protein
VIPSRSLSQTIIPNAMSGFNVDIKKTAFSEVYDHFSTQPRSKKTDDDSSLRLTGNDLHTKSGKPSSKMPGAKNPASPEKDGCP